MVLRKSGPKHEAFYQDLCAVLKKHSDVPVDEMLAVTSNFVGKLVALQDQRKMSPALAMETVSRNIEEGNREAIAAVTNMATQGRA